MESKFLNLTVESAYTFGKPVTGILKVYLYPEKEQKEYDYFESKSFEGVSMIQFFLGETDIYDEQDFRDVFVNVTLTEAHTSKYHGFIKLQQKRIDYINCSISCMHECCWYSQFTFLNCMIFCREVSINLARKH